MDTKTGSCFSKEYILPRVGILQMIVWLTSDVYRYLIFVIFRFSVDSTLRLNNKKIPFPGVGHADDLCYLFR